MKLADVSGTVTLDGKPIDNAKVFFELQTSGRRRSSYDYTDSNGNYTLIKGRDVPGAEPGKYTVRITLGGSVEDDPSQAGGGAIPAKYNRKSELTAEVEPFGNHTFDFDLTSQ